MNDLSERLQSYLDNCQKTISEYGWMIQAVATNPLWAYTVGLNVLNRPELTIVGLPLDLTKNILNTAAFLHLDQQFAPGTTIDIGWSVRFEVQQTSTDPMNVARVMNGASFQPTALQLFWPNEHGIYQRERQVILT